ncbi:hypothetical protein MGN70_006977 [Eutypa lata]|nr:hypothetical protein MGN70_006977 [Eutypa lata]
MGENPEANQLSDEESAVGSDLNFTSSPTTITTASSARSVRLGWNDYRAPKEASRHMRHMALGDCVQADLDQLYFDRVHPIAPLMHRARYFSWAHQPDQPEARAALQSAMRTLAAAASSPFQQLSNSLYAETRQMLERLDDAAEQQSTGNISLEHIQAWLLLAHYEFMRMPHRRAMMTAGRVFRMVQVALLHDVYEPDMALGDFGADPNTSWVEMEEKRRTFWVAYCLDRCIGLHERCPLTFHEDGLRTRLPAPDADFERSRPTHTDFLPEAIAASGQTILSPFAECVVFLTLWGRCILVRQPRPLAEHMYSNDSLELWARYEWLDNVLEKRRSRLAQSSPIGAVLADPMLVFTFMVADIIKIHLMNSLQSKSASTVLPHQVLAEAHGERAAEAAREIALLAKTTHPFLPSALFQGARTLLTNMSMGPAAADARGVAELLDTLRNLKGVNNLAQELLRRIEFDGLPESTSTSRLQPGWNSNDGTCMSFGPLS